MPGNLQAYSGHHASVYKVRKGETAARIAKVHGLSLEQLGSLNPKADLDHLTVGMPLRVAGTKQVRLPLRTLGPGALAGRPTVPPVPVPPLPALPALGPTSLVHLERVLLPPPSLGTGVPEASSFAPPTAAVPSLGELRKVLPAGSDNDDLPSVPSAAPSTAFEPADRENLDLLWPVQTRTISSAWGPRMRTRVVRVQTPKRSRRVLRRFLGSHKGVDLSAPKGSDIYAALDGQVVMSGRHKQYGNFVAVDHGNGVVTLYAHCNRNFVEEGEIVRRGQKIAEVGRTGNATGPHLHFELRLDGLPVNPLPRLNDMEEIPSELMAQNQAAVPPSAKR
jgi:murein DD-endopeptidase MepM/ murein hydrolase activator NlpD